MERSLDPHDIESFRRLLNQLAARDWSDPIRGRFEATRRDLAEGKELSAAALEALHAALLLNPDASPGYHLVTEDGYVVQRMDTADGAFIVVRDPEGSEEVVRAEDPIKNFNDRICKYNQLIGVADEVLASPPGGDHHRRVVRGVRWLTECPPTS